jgi:hypothetical protein
MKEILVDKFLAGREVMYFHSCRLGMQESIGGWCASGALSRVLLAMAYSKFSVPNSRNFLSMVSAAPLSVNMICCCVRKVCQAVSSLSR